MSFVGKKNVEKVALKLAFSKYFVSRFVSRKFTALSLI